MGETGDDDDLRARLRGLLRRPARLGLALNATLLAAWYAGAYLPLRERIEADARRVSAERERLELAREVEHLRREARRFSGLLPEPGDGDAWVHFVMGGIRRFPLKLVALEPRPPVEVGPYRAAVLRVTVEGPFPELERLLRWLEAAPRLIRVDSIQVASRARDGAAGGRPAVLEMQLVVTGVDS